MFWRKRKTDNTDIDKAKVEADKACEKSRQNRKAVETKLHRLEEAVQEHLGGHRVV